MLLVLCELADAQEMELACATTIRGDRWGRRRGHDISWWSRAAKRRQSAARGVSPMKKGLFGKAPSGAKEIFVCAGGVFSGSSVVDSASSAEVSPVLSPFQGLVCTLLFPTACAVVCIISPLRG